MQLSSPWIAKATSFLALLANPSCGTTNSPAAPIADDIPFTKTSAEPQLHIACETPARPFELRGNESIEVLRELYGARVVAEGTCEAATYLFENGQHADTDGGVRFYYTFVPHHPRLHTLFLHAANPLVTGKVELIGYLYPEEIFQPTPDQLKNQRFEVRRISDVTRAR